MSALFVTVPSATVALNNALQKKDTSIVSDLAALEQQTRDALGVAGKYAGSTLDKLAKASGMNITTDAILAEAKNQIGARFVAQRDMATLISGKFPAGSTLPSITEVSSILGTNSTEKIGILKGLLPGDGTLPNITKVTSVLSNTSGMSSITGLLTTDGKITDIVTNGITDEFISLAQEQSVVSALANKFASVQGFSDLSFPSMDKLTNLINTTNWSSAIIENAKLDNFDIVDTMMGLTGMISIENIRKFGPAIAEAAVTGGSPASYLKVVSAIQNCTDPAIPAPFDMFPSADNDILRLVATVNPSDLTNAQALKDLAALLGKDPVELLTSPINGVTVADVLNAKSDIEADMANGVPLDLDHLNANPLDINNLKKSSSGDAVLSQVLYQGSGTDDTGAEMAMALA